MANRKADGIADVDAAVAALDVNWAANGGASLLNEGFVEHLLSTASAWLTGRKVFGQRVTGWRAPAIRKLYWKVAWCYQCDHFVQQAIQRVNLNLGAGLPTAVTAPVPHASPVGSPYQFMNSGYAHHPLPQPPRVLRGDSRGPLAITAANGFQPRNIASRWNYAP